MARLDATHLADIVMACLADLVKYSPWLAKQPAESRPALVLSETCSCTQNKFNAPHCTVSNEEHVRKLQVLWFADAEQPKMPRPPPVDYQKCMVLVLSTFSSGSIDPSLAVLELVVLPYRWLYAMQHDKEAPPSFALRDLNVSAFVRWWHQRTLHARRVFAEQLSLSLLGRSLSQLSAVAKHRQAQMISRQHQFCNGCGKAPAGPDEPAFKLCGGCKTVAFCSTSCHKQHWPEHKLTCQFLRATFSPNEIALIKSLFGALNHSHSPVLRQIIHQHYERLRQQWGEPGQRCMWQMRLSFATLHDLTAVVHILQTADGAVLSAEQRDVLSRLTFSPVFHRLWKEPGNGQTHLDTFFNKGRYFSTMLMLNYPLAAHSNKSKAGRAWPMIIRCPLPAAAGLENVE